MISQRARNRILDMTGKMFSSRFNCIKRPLIGISTSKYNIPGANQHKPTAAVHRLATPNITSLYINCKCYSTDGDNEPLESKQGAIASLEEARKAIIFTCKVCSKRQTKTFSTMAYKRGVVIIECDGCKNRHLIADNLGWFDHVDARNIEDIMKQKGEKVKKYSSNGLLEISPKVET